MRAIVRAPALTDAVGAGMACALATRQRLADRVAPEYWQGHTEETWVQYWHDLFLTRVDGRRVALAVAQRRIVGVCGVRPTGKHDRSGQVAARPVEVFAFEVLPEFADPDLYQRLFDFVIPDLRPAQAWVWRDNQELRRFFRMNGFTLDGLRHTDPDSGLEYARLVR